MNLRFIFGLLFLLLATIIPSNLSRKTTRKPYRRPPKPHRRPPILTTTTMLPLRDWPCQHLLREDCPVALGRCKIENWQCAPHEEWEPMKVYVD